jgi:hypothetical protein
LIDHRREPPRLLSQANAGQPARVFRDFDWSTKESWTRRRQVIGKAEWAHGEANPRFLVTSLKPDAWRAKPLYERLYCARGEMENRIKKCQGDLFADRTSTATMSAAAVVGLDGLCAHMRPAPHRADPHAAGQRDLRHDPPETVAGSPASSRKTARCLNSVEYCRGVCPGFDMFPSSGSHVTLSAVSQGRGPLRVYSIPFS